MSRRASIIVPPEAYRADELMAAGVSRDRLRAADIRRFGRGLLLHPECRLDLDDYRDRCTAIGQVLRPEFFVSRRSAAILLDVPCPAPPCGRVEVASIAPARPPRRPQILGHRVRQGSCEWTECDGLTIPSPADVWCQLAAVLGLADLVAAGDHLLTGKRILNSGGRRKPPLVTPEQLDRAMRRHVGTTGSKQRARARAILRFPVDSPRETALRLLIVEAGFPEPVVNCRVPVDGRTFHADLGYPELKIAIEYEGLHHFDEPQQRKLDTRRRLRMEDAGWIVLEVMSEDIRDPRHFLGRLAAKIRGRRVL